MESYGGKLRGKLRVTFQESYGKVTGKLREIFVTFQRGKLRWKVTDGGKLRWKVTMESYDGNVV